ncbi:receptor-like protein 6 [Humulus lupulus]|uniref:receptor-like protein 6 n=1 Tax=Humulus lupulus TaxID=3486 RepID=UPI002B417DE1|nr:receptor-like protein 6 [Humulus lupulus]
MGSLILRFSFTGFLFLTLLCFSFSQPVCHDDERSSLLQFKESFIINMSASYFSSLSYSKVAFWTNKEDTRNCCMWHGVECDEITGHVIGLDLSSSYLYGSIDSTSSLFNLTHLQSLDLADNHFNYSQIPRAIKRLSMLTNLNLSYSVFSGQIPSEVSELSKLSNLDLSYNIGQVPGENVLELKKPNNLETLVSNLTSLEKLHLSYVDISSAVPKSLDNLSSLKSLLLEDCKLTGEFPINIFQLPNLQSLNVMFNKDLTVRFPVVLDQKSSLKSLLLRGTGFSGDLPSSIEKLASLTELDGGSCNFSGVIPTSIGKLKQLTSLDLSNNYFVGQIPSSIGNLTQLSRLTLSSNQFSGPIPLSFSKLINLETLWLDDNNLSGTMNFDMFNGLKNLTGLFLSRNNFSLLVSPHEINETFPQFTSLQLSKCNLRNFPEFLRHQKQIESLDLGDNHIASRIPDWMWNMSMESLDSISLSNNSLIGELSPTICSRSFLKVLDLSHNRLGGKLPQCFGNFSKSLSILKLRNNSFSGNIPQFTNGNQLTIIDFGYNLFEGKLSKSLTNCKMLGYLNVERNNLNDVFPYWLGILRELRILILQGNEFHGVIREPKTNHRQFAKLRIIDISFNSFNGRLPIEYIQSWKAMESTSAEDFEYMMSIPFELKENSSGLTLRMNYFFQITTAIKGRHRHYQYIQNIIAVINLSNNKFVGEIPEAIGNLKELYSLDLSNNHLKGGIPSSLSNLRALESLDISQNALSGKIPIELDQLSFLQYFNVSHNQLSGSIPQYHLSTFEASSYEGNVGLYGMPLQNFCGHSSSPEYSFPSSEEESSYIFQFGWKVVAIGYGCGFLIGSFVGKIVIARKPNWLVMTFGIRS